MQSFIYFLFSWRNAKVSIVKGGEESCHPFINGKILPPPDDVLQSQTLGLLLSGLCGFARGKLKTFAHLAIQTEEHLKMKRAGKCLGCKFYYITWDKRFPYGCSALGFKSKRSPFRIVVESKGNIKLPTFIIRTPNWVLS